jgi:hypothetical protein
MLRHAAARALAASRELRIEQPSLILRAGLATDPNRGSSSGGKEEEASSSPSTSPSSWLPSFVRRRLPAALGGDRLSGDLTFEEFVASLSRARRLGGLTGSAFGTSAVDSAGARGALKKLEDIAAAIPEAQARGILDPAVFGPAERRAAAEAAGVSVAAVDDLVRKYRLTREMAAEVARRHKAGEKLPTSVEELEASVGAKWSSRKGGEGGEAGGESCPLARSFVLPGRNTKCPKTGRAWKNCCGKKG